MVATRTLDRRLALLKEQERDLVNFWATAANDKERKPQSLGDLRQLLREHSTTEAEYIIAWASMFFDLLIVLAEGDAAEVERLGRSRHMFFQWMAWKEEQADTPIAVNWQRMLAFWLAYFLPEDMLGDIPEEVLDGEWTRKLVGPGR